LVCSIASPNITSGWGKSTSQKARICGMPVEGLI
jgi:hypothetical protein